MRRKSRKDFLKMRNFCLNHDDDVRCSSSCLDNCSVSLYRCCCCFAVGVFLRKYSSVRSILMNNTIHATVDFDL